VPIGPIFLTWRPDEILFPKGKNQFEKVEK